MNSIELWKFDRGPLPNTGSNKPRLPVSNMRSDLESRVPTQTKSKTYKQLAIHCEVQCLRLPGVLFHHQSGEKFFVGKKNMD